MLARREFFRAAAYTREKGVFVAIDADDFPPSRRGAATFSAQLHLPTHIASRYDPSGDASPRAVDAEPARVACSRASPARRRSRSRFSCLSREEKLLPRTRHRVVRRLTRAPSDSTEPSADGFQGRFHFLLHLRVCQRGHPDKLADQVRDRAFVDLGVSFNADRRFFARRDRENEPRRRRSASRPPRSSRRVSDAPLTRHPPTPSHRSPTVSSMPASPRIPTPRCVSGRVDDRPSSRRKQRETLPKRFSRHARPAR